MKKLFKIGYSHFKELKQKGYSLDSLFVLSLVDDGVDITQLGDENVELLMKGLIRKGLLSEEGKVTKLGTELLEFCETKASRLAIGKVKDEAFDRWWKEFPASNYFEYKGKVFRGTQNKRLKQMECRSLFNKYVTTGEFTAEEIIGATAFHIEVAKDLSFQTGKNELSFISNTHTYLLNKKFEPFVERWKNKEVIKQPEKKGALDI